MATKAGSRALLLAFGLLSLAAIASGAAAGMSSGALPAAWTRNLVAWIVGALLAVAIANIRRTGWAALVLWAAPAGLLAGFFSAAQQGVHRWVDLGPAHINVAMLLAPAAIAGLAALADRAWAWLAAFAVLALLAAQPDASQATAFGAAAGAIAVGAIDRPVVRLAVLAAVLLLIALAWLRPDPLTPIAEVEGVVGLAFASSAFLGAAMLACLVAIAAAPAALARSGPPPARLAGWALSLCLAAWIAAPFLGAFPVPFAGVGPSALVGAWLGLGLLAALMRMDGGITGPAVSGGR